jgi:hypothetical protein
MLLSSQTGLLVVSIKIKAGLPFGSPAFIAGAERGGLPSMIPDGDNCNT